MLKPLGSVVRGWSPTLSARPDDPLAIVLAAWDGVVGEEVAQNARPRRLADGVLQVVTTSSAWSQQLTFLEPRILDGLRRLPTVGEIKRLHFRVGRTLPRVSAPSTAARSSADRGSAASTRTVEFSGDALSRLRQRTTLRRRQAGSLCDTCGAALEGGKRCAPCRDQVRVRRLTEVERILYETPWLPREEIAAQLGGLGSEEYEEIRRGLLRRWWDVLARVERTGEVRPDGHERRIAASYVLLQSGLSPDRISQAVVRNLLGETLEELLATTAGGTTNESETG